MKNFLKSKLNYECQVLDNPTAYDIERALDIALGQMSYRSDTGRGTKDSRLLIYFSGDAVSHKIINKGVEKTGLKIFLSEDE